MSIIIQAKEEEDDGAERKQVKLLQVLVEVFLGAYVHTRGRKVEERPGVRGVGAEAAKEHSRE